MRIFYSILVIWGCFLLPFKIYAQEYNYLIGLSQHLDYSFEPPEFSYQKFSGIKYGQPNASVCNNKGELMLYLNDMDSLPPVRFGSHNIWYHITNNKNQSIGGLNKASFVYDYLFLRMNDSLYYLFYIGTDTTANPPPVYMPRKTGLYHAVINIHANNGKGAIVAGNNDSDLVPYSKHNISGISATQNTDSSWWVITRAGDSLYAVKVTASAISPAVATYDRESVYPVYKRRNPEYFFFRFSNTGSKVSTITNYSSDYYDTLDKLDEAYFTLYDFDKSAGRFNMRQQIKKIIGDGVDWTFMDMEFSPNDSFLYLLYSDTLNLTRISQYETFSFNILQSDIIIYKQLTNNDISYNTFELGQNSRIILTSQGYNSMGYIYRPNLKGNTCTVVHNVKTIECPLLSNPNYKYCGEFAFPFTRYHGNKMEFSHAPRCDSSTQMVNLCDKSKFTGYKWYIYGTAGNMFADSAVGMEPIFRLPKDGRYWVKLRGITPSGYEPWYSDTIEFKFLPVPKAKFSAISNTGCKYVGFNFIDSTDNGGSVSPTNGQTWQWSFGDGKDSTVNLPGGQGLNNFYHVYSQTGDFPIKLKYTNGYCPDSFILANTIKIYDAPQPGIALSKAIGCNPFTVNVKRTFLDTITQIIYSPGDGNPEISPAIINSTDGHAQFSYANPGNYWLVQTLTGPTGCVTKDSVQVNVLAGFEAGKQPLLRFATVVDDKEVVLEWDTFANTKSYILSRSLNKIGWKDIATISDETVQQFTDAALSPKHIRYFYKLTTIDTCENKAESNLASTILLTGKTEKNDFSVIEWTPYEDWPFGIKEYTIETKDILNNWINIASTGNLNYKDETFSDGAGTEKCYRITAVSNDIYTSSSNTVCLPFQPVILIPNSFTPNDDLLNDVYTVSTLGITELKITIYNIWGELLFTCNGLNCAWDGTYKTKACPTGVYTYLITARTNENKFVNTTGQITLIR